MTEGIGHVVVIVEENHSRSSILGNRDAPYINKLAAANALATNYRAVAHPSLPNYLAMTSGTTARITTDCTPGDGCMAEVPNIAELLEASGRTWKMYAQSMPAPCTAADSGTYAVRHNPFMYYPGVTGDSASCRAHVVPLPRLDEDLRSAAGLPDLVFIAPNLCNDMHDCSVATGDAWLSHLVPRILASPAFTTQNSLLVLTWDEDENDGGNNTVPTILAGPAARQGVESRRPYNHYSLLRTLENLWGLPPLTANDGKAATMDDLLR
ncbi:alkaline phosphatase family protein [Paeniglutamicibacter sp. R2-26]|uniref:alkaline phosphatase family protein n=1 Tax=Paeniglutamicibacter sp. R2-26 TaxID=3144417 RepID=UPI003EE5365C